MARRRNPNCIANHGENPARYASGGCKACIVEASRRRSAECRGLARRVKVEAGCQRCGYRRCAEALQFHHRDPAGKLFPVAMAADRSLRVLRAEIAKCDVLCANCHAELHAEGRAATVPSGTSGTVAP